MYFRTLHRATLAQAPEGTDYEAGGTQSADSEPRGVRSDADV